MLADVITRLDVRREQVLVEAIVVEVSDTAARELGVQFILGGGKGDAPFAVTNYTNTAPNILALAGAIAGLALVTVVTPEVAPDHYVLDANATAFGDAGPDGDTIEEDL
eukprot:gene61588-biopygen44737